MVLYTVVMLTMVMAFILIAISAWQNEGSFILQRRRAVGPRLGCGQGEQSQ